MKLRIQTLTGQVGEVEVDPRDTILDLKVCRILVLLIYLSSKTSFLLELEFEPVSISL